MFIQYTVSEFCYDSDKEWHRIMMTMIVMNLVVMMMIIIILFNPLKYILYNKLNFMCILIFLSL